jgi:hypothetical protein
VREDVTFKTEWGRMEGGKEGERGERERERDEDATLLKIEEVAMSQGMQMASRRHKINQETCSPLQPPRGRKPCQHLDFNPPETYAKL